MDAVKEALNQLSSNVQISTAEVTPQQEIKSQLQETEVSKVECIEIKTPDFPQTPQEQIQEKAQVTEEP
ncbi:MAG: hypothetical protein ACUVTE_07550, partial [Candidatus Bathycorpusculaceae bacterium]